METSHANPVASPELEILIQLLKLGSFINTPMKDGVCDPGGIGPTELKIIMALAGEGALAGHDLVEIMGVTAMNVSRGIKQLRALGLVEDSEDSGNRRRRPVRLSAAGAQAYAQFVPLLNTVAEALVGSLSKVQRRHFSASADIIIANMANWITQHHGDVVWDG